MKITLWTMTTDDGTNAISGIFPTQAAAHDALAENYASDNDLTGEALVEYVQSQGVTVIIDSEEVDLPERIVMGHRDISPAMVATMTGDGDIEVQVFYSERSGKQVVQIDTEQHAQFEVLVNDGRVATVSQGGGVVNRFDDGMEFTELDAIRAEAERRIAALPLIVSDMQPGIERSRAITAGELRTERVAITWSEVVTYKQDITIDVPGGYTGPLSELIDVDDDGEFEGQDYEGVPQGWKTGWLDRADMSAPAEVQDRQIHGVERVTEQKDEGPA